MMRLNEEKRKSYAYILSLTVPIIIQNLFSAAVNSVDVLMLNSVGQSAISAVSLATQYSNVLVNIFGGLGSGVSMLCAQYWGKQDLKAIERVQNIAFWFACITALIFAIPSITIPRLMMQVYTNDAELIRIGAGYLQIVGFSHLMWGLAETYFATLRSMEKVKISTSISVFALLLNIFLNAVFIYGWFGAPKLGVIGVAIATAFSRIVQFGMCLIVSHFSVDLKLRMFALSGSGKELLKDFIRLSLPALVNTVVWSVGYSMYSAILGHISSDVIAANSIVSVVKSFGTVLCYAVSGASGIYVGKSIGANQMEKARQDAKYALTLSVITGAIGGVIILLISPFVLRVAVFSETAMSYLKIMLVINSVYIMGTAVNSTLIAGVFRAGGDSRFGLVCDFIDMWCYAVPVGLISAFVLKLPPMVVYVILCTDEFVKWPWVFKRYKSGKWLNNITRE